MFADAKKRKLQLNTSSHDAKRPGSEFKLNYATKFVIRAVFTLREALNWHSRLFAGEMKLRKPKDLRKVFVAFTLPNKDEDQEWQYGTMRSKFEDGVYFKNLPYHTTVTKQKKFCMRTVPWYLYMYFSSDGML